MQESVWNNRYPRFQCTLHIAGNRLGVVCIHYRPFPSEEEEQNAMDDLERKSQGHVKFSDSVINEYTTKLCSYVYICFFIGRVLLLLFWWLTSIKISLNTCVMRCENFFLFFFSFAKVPLSLYFYICFLVWFFIFRIILFKIRLMKKCT